MNKTVKLFSLIILCMFFSTAYAQDQPGAVKFPGGLDTPDSLIRAADNVSSTTAAPVTASATLILLLSTAGFPSTGMGTIEGEKFVWTSKSVSSLTGVTRGVGGTTAVAHGVGVAVRLPILSSYHNTLAASLVATQAKIGYGSSLAASGKFLKGIGAGQSVWGDVLIADVQGLQSALDSKAASFHTHIIADTTGLQGALDAKAASSHTHADATTSTSGFESAADKTKLNSIATGATANSTDAQLRDRSTHTGSQPISTVAGLQTALDSKAASVHTHAIADTTGLQAALDAKALSTDLTAESSARASGDTSEASTRSSADTTLQSNITNEANARAAADTAEASARAAADATLQPLDSDLTVIAAIAPTNDDVIQRKSGAWINRSIAQLKADFALAIADVSGLQAALNAKVALARAINTGNGLQGGGDLSADRTIDLRLNISGGLSKILGTGSNELGIAAAGVSNAMLANNYITVNTTSPLSGGGAVSLGGALTLTTSAASSVVNDTNVTGSITSNVLTLAWTGALAKARQHSATVYNDQANVFGNFAQTFQAAANFNLVDPTDTTKKAQFDLSNIATGATRTVNVPNANSTGAQAKSAVANQFLNSMSAQGVFGSAQPAFSDLSGLISTSQQPSTTVNSIVNDTNVTASIATQALTLGWTGQLSTARGGTGQANLTDLPLTTPKINQIKDSAGTVALDLGTVGSSSLSPRVIGVLNSTGSVAGVGNVSTSETTLATYTLPADALNVDGKTLRIIAFGTYAANANGKTFKVYFGATVLATKNVTNQGSWYAEGRVIRASATTQVSFMRAGANNANGGSENINGPDVEAPAETLSGTVVIKATGTGAASNDLLLKGFIIEILN